MELGGGVLEYMEKPQLSVVEMNMAKEKKHGKTKRFIVLASVAYGSKYAALSDLQRITISSLAVISLFSVGQK